MDRSRDENLELSRVNLSENDSHIEKIYFFLIYFHVFIIIVMFVNFRNVTLRMKKEISIDQRAIKYNLIVV